ncbi:protein bicaudal C 1 [Caerostris extrusa]|uniref:Protein bicaudal C 1 n=1 Tax=Caerostris extrusa TaxID=172846 RepID=A0AAV4TTB5_CAEEX|nr:protein bicaudal C 1 [Caerostris extrusa]
MFSQYSPSKINRVSDSLSSNPESPTSSTKEPNGSSSDTESIQSGLTEERFRIDRKKLEDMLQVQHNGNGKIESAEDFFQKVMLETSTQISWPSKLKIGAKSKKASNLSLHP